MIISDGAKPMADRTVGAAEFRTHCLRIFNEIDRTGETVTITKRGRPIAQVRRVAKGTDTS